MSYNLRGSKAKPASAKVAVDIAPMKPARGKAAANKSAKQLQNDFLRAQAEELAQQEFEGDFRDMDEDFVAVAEKFSQFRRGPAATAAAASAAATAADTADIKNLLLVMGLAVNSRAGEGVVTMIEQMGKDVIEADTEEGRMAPFKIAMKAVQTLEGLAGHTWAAGSHLSGARLAYDVVANEPTASITVATTNVLQAAVAQGLVRPANAQDFTHQSMHMFGSTGMGGGLGMAPQLPVSNFVQYRTPAGGQGARMYSNNRPRMTRGVPKEGEFCWRCGSNGHYSTGCPVPANPTNPFPYKPAGFATGANAVRKF